MLLCPVPWNNIRSSMSSVRFTFRSWVFFLTRQKADNFITTLILCMSPQHDTSEGNSYLQKNSHKSKFWILCMHLMGWSMVLSYSRATSLNSYVSLPSWMSCSNQSQVVVTPFQILVVVRTVLDHQELKTKSSHSQTQMH